MLERERKIAIRLLITGSAALPVTQSARSQSDNSVMPLNASVFGHGFDARYAVGA